MARLEKIDGIETTESEKHRSDRLRQFVCTDPECGCKDPVATNPKDMLEFLAGRFEFAGVSHGVALSYAQDIRMILKEHYGVE